MADFTNADKFNAQKSFVQVQFSAGSRLLEVELNELQKVLSGGIAGLIRQLTTSGVIECPAVSTAALLPTAIADGQLITSTNYVTIAANTINMGKYHALVNGYILPIYNTVYTNNRHDLLFSAPPATGTRVDLAFLEFWQEQINYTESILQYGGAANSTLPNDLLDSRIGLETTRRVQLKWRIRVAGGIDSIGHPNLLDDPNVKAWGGTGSITTWAFSQTANDTGLFVAGDGTSMAQANLNTTDGYVYAIPLIQVNRRATITAIASTDLVDLRKPIYTLTSIKAQLDSINAGFANGTYIRKDGTVAMTSELTLSGDPTQALSASTKQYVDDTALIMAMAMS